MWFNNSLAAGMKNHIGKLFCKDQHRGELRNGVPRAFYFAVNVRAVTAA